MRSIEQTNKQFIYNDDDKSGKAFATVVIYGNVADTTLPSYTIHGASEV